MRDSSFIRIDRVDRGQSEPRGATESELRMPSLLEILRHDNASFLLASFGPVLLAMALCIAISDATPGGRGRPSRPADPEAAQAFVIVTAALTAFLWILASLRVWRVRRLFEVGEEVEARVEAVRSCKGRTRLELEYEHGGARYRTRASIRRSERARALKAEERVRILVIPSRPKRLVLAELYD